jgi:C-terminal processing protease CtpA/Prc
VVNKISDMYVGKNHGYSRAYAEGYERIFGASKPPLRHTEGKSPSSNDDIDVAWRFATITFPEGPLGLEVTWSSPPVVTAAFPEGAAASAGICVGDIIVEANGVQVASGGESHAERLAERPLSLRVARHIAE